MMLWGILVFLTLFIFSHACNPHGGSTPVDPSTLPRDCADLQAAGNTDATAFYQTYKRSCSNPLNCVVMVQCDFTTLGGRWTLIQQRVSNVESFNRVWADYKAGFGSLGQSFYIGNDYLNELTALTGQSYELRIELTPLSTSASAVTARYDVIKVDSEALNYALTLGTLLQSGSTVDNLANSRNQPFGTSDRDTDLSTGSTCGQIYRSGFWFNPTCGYTGNLNIPYDPVSGQSLLNGIVWQTSSGDVRMQTVVMKIRPV